MLAASVGNILSQKTLEDSESGYISFCFFLGKSGYRSLCSHSVMYLYSTIARTLHPSLMFSCELWIKIIGFMDVNVKL